MEKTVNTQTPLTSPNSDDKIWMILCHLSMILGFGIILPLIVYLVKKQDSPVAAEHAKEALNFQISVYIYGFVAGILCFLLIGFFLLPLILFVSIILAIIATVKAFDGNFYRYPLTLRLLK